MKRRNSTNWLRILVDGVPLSENQPIHHEYFEVWRSGKERVFLRSKSNPLILKNGDTTKEVTLPPNTTHRVRKSLSVSIHGVFYSDIQVICVQQVELEGED